MISFGRLVLAGTAVGAVGLAVALLFPTAGPPRSQPVVSSSAAGALAVRGTGSIREPAGRGREGHTAFAVTTDDEHAAEVTRILWAQPEATLAQAQEEYDGRLAAELEAVAREVTGADAPEPTREQVRFLEALQLPREDLELQAAQLLAEIEAIQREVVLEEPPLGDVAEAGAAAVAAFEPPAVADEERELLAELAGLLVQQPPDISESAVASEEPMAVVMAEPPEEDTAAQAQQLQEELEAHRITAELEKLR